MWSFSENFIFKADASNHFSFLWYKRYRIGRMSQIVLHVITIEHIALHYNELFHFTLRFASFHFAGLLKGVVWLKALFFVDFHPFSYLAKISFKQKMTLLSYSPYSSLIICEFLDDFSNVFNV